MRRMRTPAVVLALLLSGCGAPSRDTTESEMREAAAARESARERGDWSAHAEAQARMNQLLDDWRGSR